MMRHLLTFNVADPLAEDSRGASEFTQYFSGTGASGQINYLERKQATGGKLIVSVGGVTKTAGVDYTYSNTTGRITWTSHTPAAGSDNILVEMTAIMPWIYDDNPSLDTVKFPRLSVLDVTAEHEDSGQGIYASYLTGPGQFVTRTIKVIARERRNTRADTATYGGLHLKNYELVQAISQAVQDYINTNALPVQWKYWRWHILRGERIYSEEDVHGIIRRDLTISLQYFDGVK